MALLGAAGAETTAVRERPRALVADRISLNHRQKLIAILMGGLIVRLALVWLSRGLVPFQAQNSDQADYVQMGQRIAAGEWFGSSTYGYYFGRAPLYPIFLGGLFKLGGLFGLSAPAQVLVGSAQAMLGVLTVGLTSLIATRREGERIGLRTALWATALLAVFEQASYMSEQLFIPLTVGALALLSGRQRPSHPRLLAAGSLLGLATLTRPAGGLLILAAGLLVWRAFPQGSARRWSLGCLVVGFGLVVSTWLGYTWNAVGRPLIDTNTGLNLCLGNSDGATGVFRNGACEGDPAVDPVSRDGRLATEAVRWMVRHPLQQPGLIRARAEATGVSLVPNAGGLPWQYNTWPQAWRYSIDGVMSLLYLGAFYGWIRALWRSRRRSFVRSLGVWSLALLVPPLMTIGETRFHMAVLPVMAISVAWLSCQPRLLRPAAAQKLRQLKARLAKSSLRRAV